MGALPAIAGFKLTGLVSEGPYSKLYAATIDSSGGRHRLVGESPSGRVFTGECLVDGEPCAVRVFDREAVTAESLLEFIRVRRAAAACRGAGIADFIASVAVGERPFVAMMDVSAETLGSLLKRERLSVSRAREIAGLVCMRLAALHEGGHVHGALTPSTILVRLRSRGGVEVSLEHIGAHVLEAQDLGDTVTYTDDPSVDYLAPELLMGSVASPTPACDLYALGVILFESIAGAGPFRGSQLERVQQRLHGAPPRLQTRQAAVPHELDKLVSSLLCRDAQGRPGSARLLASTLSTGATEQEEQEGQEGQEGQEEDGQTAVFIHSSATHDLPSGPGSKESNHTVVLGGAQPSQVQQHTVVLAGETMVPESGVTVLPEAFRMGAPEFLETTTLVPRKRSVDDTASGDDTGATICPGLGVRPLLPKAVDHRAPQAPEKMVLPLWLRGWSSQKKLLVINIVCLVVVLIGLVIIVSSR